MFLHVGDALDGKEGLRVRNSESDSWTKCEATGRLTLGYMVVFLLPVRWKVFAPGAVSAIGELTTLVSPASTSSSSNQSLAAPKSIFQTLPSDGSVSTMSLDYR